MRKTLKSVAVFMSALVAVTGAMVASTAPAHAATAPGPAQRFALGKANIVAPAYTYSGLHNLAATGKCLDNTSSTSNGTQPVIWTCNGQRWQFWTLIPVNNGMGDYVVVNKNSGKCLSVLDNSLKDGAPLDQWTCAFDGSNLFELWYQIFNATGTSFELNNEGSGGEIAPINCNTANGTKIVSAIYGCPNAGYWYWA